MFFSLNKPPVLVFGFEGKILRWLLGFKGNILDGPFFGMFLCWFILMARVFLSLFGFKRKILDGRVCFVYFPFVGSF